VDVLSDDFSRAALHGYDPSNTEIVAIGMSVAVVGDGFQSLEIVSSGHSGDARLQLKSDPSFSGSDAPATARITENSFASNAGALRALKWAQKDLQTQTPHYPLPSSGAPRGGSNLLPTNALHTTDAFTDWVRQIGGDVRQIGGDLVHSAACLVNDPRALAGCLGSAAQLYDHGLATGMACFSPALAVLGLCQTTIDMVPGALQSTQGKCSCNGGKMSVVVGK
jgi:hypothetical protein